MKYYSKTILRDEKEWIKRNTRPLDKAVPFLKRHVILKYLLILFIWLLLFVKFHKLFFTLIAVAFISYIRYKRMGKGIPIEFEPTYLFAIAIALAFGINYSIAFILIPNLFTLFRGISIAFIVNIASKIIVVIAALLYWNFTRNQQYMILFATLMVFMTDLLGFSIRKKFGQPFFEIMQVMLTNTIIRYIYFSIFLDIVISLIR